MRDTHPSALTAAILTAPCLFLATCGSVPAPGPAHGHTTLDSIRPPLPVTD